ncbi:MAG: Uncharacterized protein AWU55_754 [Halomonadaceae bacterium T82-2]|nr:MAG: Uncharacterized protein AWU55_754 [Halomonadaceae bacterium T82-2]
MQKPGRMRRRLKRLILREQAKRANPSPYRKAGTHATRQQFLEATRNVGVIVVATCFTAGWVITNPSVNTDGVGWGVLMGLVLIFIGAFGYGYVERDKASDERGDAHE